MEIKVIDIKEEKDGSAILTVDIDNEAENFIKAHYCRKRWSNKIGEQFILEGLTNAIKQLGKDNDKKRTRTKNRRTRIKD